MRKITKKEREIAINFMNWTMIGECQYTCNDEDSWNPTSDNPNQEQINTAQLFDIYSKTEGY